MIKSKVRATILGAFSACAVLANAPLHAQDAAPAAAATAKPTKTPRPEEFTLTSYPDTEAFVYAKRGENEVRLFVAKPKDWTAQDKRPAFIYFFGGGWTHGTPENSVSWAKSFAKAGMVGIAPDYRTKNRFNTSPMDAVADGRASLRWVQDHAAELGVDPSRIVVGGTSAGGHLAWWTAIEHAPVGSDPAESPKAKPAALVLISAVDDTSPATGYTPTRFGANGEALSPVNQLDAKMPPTLLFHGDADQTVPYAQAVAISKKMTDTGNHCEFVTVPGGTHSFRSDLPEWKDKSRDMIIKFLSEQKLLPEKTSPRRNQSE